MNEKEILIGCIEDEIGKNQAKYLADRLTAEGIEHKIGLFCANHEMLLNSLCDGKIDVAVRTLSDVPIEASKDWMIVGLSSREYASDGILISKENYDATEPLRIKKHSRVLVPTLRMAAQILEISNSLQVKQSNDLSVIDRLSAVNEGRYHATIVAKADIDWLKIDIRGANIIDLHPREFVPKAGQGVIAYLTNRDDIELRKLLQPVSERDVAYCTNVERKLQQMLEDKLADFSLGVYCEKDKMRNYHAWAVLYHNDEISRVRVSQNTYVGLPQALYQEIIK